MIDVGGAAAFAEERLADRRPVGTFRSLPDLGRDVLLGDLPQEPFLRQAALLDIVGQPPAKLDQAVVEEGITAFD
jgi:hypothetical protein